jgi:hypothetical protein
VTEEPTGIALNPEWTERYLEGSPEAEERLLEAFAEQIRQVQARNRKRDTDPIRRAFHAKLLAGVVNARFEVAAEVRPELRVGPFVPGAHPAIVRFSNASGIVRADSARDLRGLAIRLQVGDSSIQDLLFSNARTSHSRNAVQFMSSAVAMAGGRRTTAIPRLIARLGVREGLRVFLVLRRSASRRVRSLATESYFGRLPFAVGRFAVKFALLPLAADSTSAPPSGPDGLRREFLERLRRDDVRFRLEALHFEDETTTPIEDATVEWIPRTIAPDALGTLVIPRQDLTEGEGPAGERTVEAMEFNPWNSVGIRPIGSLNRARKPVYEASARLRSGRPD